MKEIIRVFLKLGFLGFGGALALISMMEDECVRKRRWCTQDEFSRTFALLKILPGPIAAQFAVHLGRVRGGLWGGLVAGLCFVLPSFFVILGLGLTLAQVAQNSFKLNFVTGMQVAAVGVIVQGAWRLAKGNVENQRSYIIAAISLVVVLFKPGLEPLVILFFGILGVLLSLRVKAKLEAAVLLAIAWLGIKAALLTFGSGLAIVPLLEHDVVEKYKWLTHGQFLEAVALGQITPGPVTITLSWIGYQVFKMPGAIVATAALFLPAFLMALFFMPAVEKKWGSHPLLGSFYDFVIPSVVGGMFAVTMRLIFVTIRTPVSAGVFGASLYFVFWKKLPPWLVILVSGFMAVALAQGEKFWKF